MPTGLGQLSMPRLLLTHHVFLLWLFPCCSCCCCLLLLLLLLLLLFYPKAALYINGGGCQARNWWKPPPHCSCIPHPSLFLLHTHTHTHTHFFRGGPWLQVTPSHLPVVPCALLAAEVDSQLTILCCGLFLFFVAWVFVRLFLCGIFLLIFKHGVFGKGNLPRDKPLCC